MIEDNSKYRKQNYPITFLDKLKRERKGGYLSTHEHVFGFAGFSACVVGLGCLLSNELRAHRDVQTAARFLEITPNLSAKESGQLEQLTDLLANPIREQRGRDHHLLVDHNSRKISKDVLKLNRIAVQQWNHPILVSLAAAAGVYAVVNLFGTMEPKRPYSEVNR